jgi:hypothetical protein
LKEQPEVKVERVALAALKAYDGNAKRHDNANIDAIENSIKEFGFRNPIVAWHNEDGAPEIVAGHGRALAAQRLGLQDVPVVFVDDLTDAQRRMLTLADNQTTLMTGWDEEQLAAELDALRSEFDVSSFGFDGLDAAVGGSLDDKYSQNIGHVDYQPSDRRWEPSDLYYQTGRFDEMIEGMDAPEGIKELCRIRAHWFCEFDFAKVADYYCNQATPEVKGVFESLALVLLDRDQMIEKGFARLVEDIVGDEDD